MEKDNNGKYIPYDDLTLLDDHFIFRKVRIDQIVAEPDGSFRVSSGLFSPSSTPNHGISCDNGTEISSLGLYDSYIESARAMGLGVVKLKIGAISGNSALRVGKTPLDENPHHVEIWGEARRLTQGQQNYLVRQSEIVEYPPNFHSTSNQELPPAS